MLTDKNRSQYIETYKSEIRRIESRTGSESDVSVFAENIGNIFRHFDMEEASEWYIKAIDCAKIESVEPQSRMAFLYWKANNLQALAQECGGIIAVSEERIRTPKGIHRTRRAVTHSYHELTIALLLSGQFDAARTRASEGLSLGIERNALGFLRALALLADAIHRRDRLDFGKALRLLRDHIEEWPSAQTSRIHDCYRYALSIEQDVFGAEGDL